MPGWPASTTRAPDAPGNSRNAEQLEPGEGAVPVTGGVGAPNP